MPVITPARAVDLDEVASVLAAAFRLDPPAAALIPPGAPRREARLADLFRALLGAGPFARGTVDVARDAGSGEVLGAAIWHAPDAARSAVAHDLPQARRFLAALGVGGLWRGVQAARACAAHRPSAGHWYLQAIGVDPRARGRGIGTALLDHRLAVADLGAVGAYLEASTDESAALYARLGFRSLGPVAGFPAPGEPTSKWRPPQVQRSALVGT